MLKNVNACTVLCSYFFFSFCFVRAADYIQFSAIYNFVPNKSLTSARHTMDALPMQTHTYTKNLNRKERIVWLVIGRCRIEKWKPIKDLYLWFENPRLANCTIIKRGREEREKKIQYYNKHTAHRNESTLRTEEARPHPNKYDNFRSIRRPNSKFSVFISFNKHNSIELLCAHFCFIKIYGNHGRP